MVAVKKLFHGFLLLAGLFISVVLFTPFAIGQTVLPDKTIESPEFSIDRLDVSAGLPSNVITGITKDSDGFMWFSTQGGLCKWDGFRAIRYHHHENDSNSLIGDQIPRNGMIWDQMNRQLVIGTREGISFFNPADKTFTNFFVDPTGKKTLPSQVNMVFSDRQGTIWAGTDKGISRFNAEFNNFTNFTFRGTFPPDIIIDRIGTNQIHDIRQDLKNDSILWLASLAGLLKFNKYTGEFGWFFFPDKNYLREINQFTMIIPHPDGRLFLGTWNFDMVVFNTRSEKFTGRYGPDSKEKSATANRILPYAVNREGDLWISSLQGLGIMNTQSGEINFIQSFKNENGHRIAPEFFFSDDNGQLWLGSEYGVFILKPRKRVVSNYFFNPVDEDHWYLTLTLFEDTTHNELLIGYGRGEGLHRFNLETKRFSVIPYQQRIITEYNISAMLQAQSGEIYFLAADEIYQYFPGNNKIVALQYPYGNFPAFTDIRQDPQGRIWVASGNLGLQQFDPGSHAVKDIRNWNHYFKTGHELPLIAEICIDPKNRIWFRRRGESFGYYNVNTDSLHYFNEPGKIFDLTCFGDFSGDTLWVATAKNGLGYINIKNPDKGVIPAFALDSIFPGIIEDMILDKKNRLWCLTEKGLLRLNTKDGKHVLFDENYGITIRDAWSNKNALIPGRLKLLSDGRMVIGYRRGLGFFYPDSLKVLHQTPEPYLTSIKIFDKEISTHGDQFLKLNYDQNYLTIGYSALDLYNRGTHFRHKLTRMDKNWHESLPSQEASYPNLQPGSYQFKVQAVSDSGFGERKMLTLKIRILPPWWRTVWAYAIFLLMISVILYVFYRFQLNRQLAHREAHRLRELDALKTKLYANITHEFRTPITVIMGLAEELADSFETSKKEHFRKKLETIQRNGVNLLHLVNQMLDLAKLEHGKLKFNPRRSNIIPWLQYIVESHQSLAAAKEIQLTFYPETEKLEMDFDPDQLSKVVSNLLTNAIKFTGERGKVICHVKFENATNSFHIKVKDTGIGIPETEHIKIFDRFYQVESTDRQNSGGTGIGLSLTKEIVGMIGGTISVKSQPGKGSEFEVVLPVTRNALETSSEKIKNDKLLILKSVPMNDLEKDQEDISNGNERPLVLIAEDNPDVAGFIRDTIRTQYKVKWASDGEKALQLAFELIPDLIITDLMMPGKDGFEVCNTLKTDERTDHIPVIMLTAKVTDEDRISGFERGADAYITKPFNKKELLVRLKQLLRLRRQLQSKFGKLDLKDRPDKQLSPEEQFILKASQIVEINLEKSMFNASNLAGEIHLSESQLYRKLKAITGKSTAIFIRAVRLKKAMEFLKSSNLSVSEIAYQVGFNDPAWFSRVFKEEFGISPTEARLQ